MADISYSWCPGCRKWVPEYLMNYDTDPDTGQLIRVCTPCLEGTSDDNKFVSEPYHESTRCVYCGSYNTVEQRPKWLWYLCKDCGNTFRRF